ILLPALGRARQSAKELICKSNLRQLALATSTYQIDQRGRFPQPGQDSDIPGSDKQAEVMWFNALDPYLDQQKQAYNASKSDERNSAQFRQAPVWLDLSEDDQKRVRTIKMNEFLGNLDNRAGLPAVKFYTQDMMKLASSTVVY